MLIKQSNINGWMDMLKNMMWDVYADNHADKELEKLFKKEKDDLHK